MEEFCGSLFWDEYISWNTTNPNFTPCFQKTVLIWVPCAFLWLFTPLQIRFILRYKPQHASYTGLNVFKFLSNLVLIACSLTKLADTVIQYRDSNAARVVFPVDFSYPVIEAVSFLLILILDVVHMRVGIYSSSLLLIFWFVKSLTGIVIYRSVVLEATSEEFNVAILYFVISSIEFPFTVVQFILSCFADTIIDSQNENPCPVTHASPVSKIFYSYYSRLAWKGFRGSLEKDDLWTLYQSFQADQAYACYQKVLTQEKNKIKKKVAKNRPPNENGRACPPPSVPLVKMVYQMIKWEFLGGMTLKIIADLLGFVSPLMLNLLIDFTSNNEPLWRGILYAVILYLSNLANALFGNAHVYRMHCIGVRLRAAIMSAIYRKALRTSNNSKYLYTTGEIVNLMSVDAQKIMDFWVSFGQAFSMPLQVTLAFVFLWNLLGPVVAVGLTVTLILMPLHGFIARKTSKAQMELMKQKDYRTNQMNEILAGIKIVKLYAWELSFYDVINKIRTTELTSLKKILLLQAILTFIVQLTPLMISLSTFATYVLSDPNNILDANTAFVSLSLLDLMRVPLNAAPAAIANLIQTYVAMKRIDKFFAVGEIDSTTVSHNLEDDSIIISEGSFSWGIKDEPILHNINLKIPTGQLLAVVGTVGAGKSSLISCILGEMEKIQGYVNTKGSIAYVAQQAWIQNTTLKNNILFSKNMNVERYQTIIEACALQPDLAILPAGDETEIGEKGINLSGGQKQRVSLARAIYADSDVYLLDDPLSAVDSHVGKHIFENIVGPKGLLKRKTRILVTHGISCLPNVDVIVVMKGGTISEIGSYKELTETGGAFAEFILAYLKEHDDIDEDEAKELLNIKEKLLDKIEDENIKRSFTRQISRALSSDDDSEVVSPSHTPRNRHKSSDIVVANNVQKGGQLTHKEKMETGKVDWAVNWFYSKAIGSWLSLATLLAICFTWASSAGSNVWLGIWTNDQPLPDGTQNTQLRDLRLGIYGAFGLSQAIFSLTASLTLAWGSLKAARHLHNTMLMNILRCPMSFFDTTPLGRIINRFSRDIDVVDVAIPTYIRHVLDQAFQITGAIVVISMGFPILLVAFVPIGIIYYFIQRLYIDAGRQLKRMESVSRSPIYSHFSETISGLATIRAFRSEDTFVQTLEDKVTENLTIYFPLLVSKRWVTVRLLMIGTTIVLLASMFSVFGRENLDPGLVGLVLTYSISMTTCLMWFVREWTVLESEIVSVERVKEYSEVETEASWKGKDYLPNSSWPEKGQITFQGYSTCYRKGLDLVLRGISCDILSGQKVGIVGRTGAGKSSLTLALFRIIEASEGSIKIDGVDIAKLGLYDLRQRVVIIPQEPTLFFGTLRLNIDPSNNYSDDDIWRALEHSHLKEFVSKQKNGLEHLITAGGENLSVGQRQLVCLTRALLRKTKILVLDEATAAIDLETDDLIQATIRAEFADCTVLTIAHRLNTVMDSDLIMVLDNGTIKEYDSPTRLLENKDSIFYSLAEDAGLV